MYLLIAAASAADFTVNATYDAHDAVPGNGVCATVTGGKGSPMCFLENLTMIDHGAEALDLLMTQGGLDSINFQ